MQLLSILIVPLLAVIQPANPTARVHDFSNLLSPEQEQQLEQLSREVERKTTAELNIVTVQSLEGETVDSYANQLFQSWGMGKRKFNNGILLLVAPTERRTRIEAGYGVEALLTDQLSGQILDNHVVPFFKRNDYAGGIMSGANELARILEADPAAARGDPNSGPVLARTSRHRAIFATAAVAIVAAGIFIVGVIVAVRRLYSPTMFVALTAVGVVIIAVAAYFLLRTQQPQQLAGWFTGASLAGLGAWGFNFMKYRRFGPHGCSKCGTHLQLLNEQEEDPKLTEIQQLEERIGSVDYDVWFCPACLHNDTERYVRFFSGFTECPACHARTFKRGPQETIVYASTVSTGSARVESRCVSCNHKTVENIVLPMIVKSSGGSGGSSSWGSRGGGGWSGGGGGGGFGGGSSGGGGASRGW